MKRDMTENEFDRDDEYEKDQDERQHEAGERRQHRLAEDQAPRPFPQPVEIGAFGNR